MNAGKYIYGKLSGTAGVTTLVSTRIYPVFLPQDAVYPAVVYSVNSAPLDNGMKDQKPYHDRDTVTLNIWADVSTGLAGYASIENVDAAIRTALEFVTGTSNSVECESCKRVGATDLFEGDAMLMGRAVTYELTIKNP